MNVAEHPSIMATLRAETREAHERAEKHPFQQRLLRGPITRDAYAAHLAQMFLVHRALDAALVSFRDTRPELGCVVEPWQLQSPYLSDDLAFLGVDETSIATLPATAALVARFEVGAPLLGYHYVLEGSNNGSRFIAKAIRRAIGLEGTQGTRYLDPYGEEQPARWKAFKVAFDLLPLTADERLAIVEAAREMFDAIGRISTELEAEVDRAR